MREIARPLSEWSDDIGDVLWWKFPIEEAPYVGTPNDRGQVVEIAVTSYGVAKLMRFDVGGWPGYHTHWTPMPSLPAAPPALGPPTGEEHGQTG